MNAAALGLSPTNAPQQPFIFQGQPRGPTFLDTEACVCALQDIPSSEGNDAAHWQCIGNQTEGVYTTRRGKWFAPSHVGAGVGGSINDDSNPPDTSKTLYFAMGRLSEPQSESVFSIYDQACTGKNNSRFSESFYAGVSARARGQPSQESMPCWYPGGLPIQIQEPQACLGHGCNEGFLCENNTINSLPQYCPPISLCQQLRLGGEQCIWHGQAQSMGPFEPVLCKSGHYCPKESNGKEMLECPKGTYCLPGASTPTPCSVGSYCPRGSRVQVFLIPIIILIILDILLIIGILILVFRRRARQSNHQPCPQMTTRGSGLSAMTAHITGYKQITNDNENENGNRNGSDTGSERSSTHYDPEMVQVRRPPFAPRRADTFRGLEAAIVSRNKAERPRSQELDSLLTPQLSAFVQSMRRATDANDFGLSFSYSDLKFHPKANPNPILQHVTGTIDSGTLAAIMGGSGAGKSNFVNVLMGKTRHTGGIVAVNNHPGKMKRYKKVIGYVPQDDIVLPELTVYEKIVHSARIRLPRTWTNAEIDSHVEAVIDCLELSHVRNSLVGSVAKPVISGGQRKRVSIGMELAAAPMAIFLDEPTSGLDATAASSIMRTLKALACLGISVIVIIHQPRSEIFEMFDSLVLLGNGQTIYEGPQAELQQYFESMDYQFPKHSNHADVITDIITGNGHDYKQGGDISKEALVSSWSDFRKSRGRQRTDRHTLTPMGSDNMNRALKKRGAPRIKQAWLCLRRAMLQQYRTKSVFWAEMGLASLAGFLLGLAQNPMHGIMFKGVFKPPFAILSAATNYTAAPQMALLVAIAIGLVAGAPGVKCFSEETLLQRREAEAGHSRVAYFVAKVLSVLPRMVLGNLHFTTLLFLFATPVINWGIAFFANFLYFYCIYGLAAIVSMLARREDAPLFATMISLIFGILSGAAPPLQKVKGWHMEWLWRASPGVWLAEVYFGQLVKPFAYLYDVEAAANVTGFHLNWLWRNLATLAAIGTIYRIIAFFAMWASHRFRR